ncbi:MAG: C25 family cysteine peptidase [Pseudomonadota bacterium]|nr:C25 family cysteine peptidase [Pseudomonadota bacterium]
MGSLTLAMLLLGAAFGASAQVVYTYDNTTVGALSNAATPCATPLARTFVVTDAFTVGDIAVGVDIDHINRGDLRMTLVSPSGTLLQFVTESADADDNYKAMFSINVEGALDDGDTDPVANSRYRRLVSVAGMNFYAGTSAGTWTLRMCDTVGANNGTFNSARLVLRHTAGTVASACGNNLTFDWGSLPNLTPFVSFTTGGVTLTQTATSGESPADAGTGIPSFITRTTTNGNHPGYYSLNFDTSGDPELSAENVTFTFSEAATWLEFSLLDVDRLPPGGGWEDYMRVDGFDDAGVPVPKQMVLVGAQLAYAGDWAEGDSSVANASTDGNVTYRFARPVRSLRAEYAAGDEPNDGSQVFQVIGLSDFLFCAYDYGDAPDTYNTTIAAGTVTRNTMGQRNLFMGTMPDGETDGTPGALANGDGADEDGITFPTLIIPVGLPQFWRCGAYDTALNEYCVSVVTTNSTGADAQLVGWVDFNADGDFNDANERSSPALGNGSGGAIDGTFITGNAPTGTGTRILRWTGVTNATAAQTYLRVRLSADATFIGGAANPAHNGQITGGEIEDHRIPATTLPVSLMFVQSNVSNGQLALSFASATETNNVGYSVHEKRGDAYQRISNSVLPSKRINTTEVSNYELTLAQAPPSGTFYIADHDTLGRTTMRGPFVAGQTYGVRPVLRTVNWNGVRQAVENNRLAQAAQGVAIQGAKLWVELPGFYRVTAQELLAQGVDFAGIPVDQIAVTLRDEGVPRRVYSATPNFGSGSYIDFLVRPGYSLYSKELPYLVKADGVGVVAIDVDSGLPDLLRDAWYWSVQTYSPESLYNFASPTDDPWHAGRMVAFVGAPAALSFNLPVDQVAQTEFAAQISAELIGVTNWSGAGQDHHVRLSVDGSEAAQTVFDGIREQQLSALLPNISNGNAAVVVETTGQNGFDYDVVYLDKVELRYPRLPVADQGRLFVQGINADTSGGAALEADADGGGLLRTSFEGSNARAGFVANGLLAGPLVVYAGVGDRWNHLSAVTSQAGAGGFDASVPFVAGAGDYWVSNISALGVTRVEALPEDGDITTGTADYLIISHSLFIDQLGDIVALQQSRGLTTRVVDVAQVYQQFGDSVPEGQAIRRYLQQVAVSMGVDYVLLVGADTYDYKNFLGTGSVSFVPTLYSKVGDISYTPTDSVYADINGDDAPDFAIGRLPVRSLVELAALRDKLVAIQGSNPQRRLVLVAGGTDGESDFSSISDGFAALLPGTWQPTEAYVDDVGIAQANTILLGQLNAGASLVSYVGHSAPIQWSTADQTVLTSAQVFGLNSGVSDLVVQWGCWNSYFVSPNADTMAHAFLLSPNKGAAAVIGVSALTGAEAHQALGNALYPFLAPGTRVGDALRSAKSALAGQSGLYRDILISSTLLGDPAMPIR